MYTSDSGDDGGNNKGGGNNDDTDKALPDHSPGLFGFFNVTIGRNVGVAGGNQLENHVNTGNSTDKLEDIAKEDKKTRTVSTDNVSRIFDLAEDVTVSGMYKKGMKNGHFYKFGLRICNPVIA